MRIRIRIVIPPLIRTLDAILTRHCIRTARPLRTSTPIDTTTTLLLQARRLLNDVYAFLRLVRICHVSGQRVFRAMFTVKDADAAERRCVVMRIAVLAETCCAVATAFFDGGFPRVSKLGFEVYVVELV